MGALRQHPSRTELAAAQGRLFTRSTTQCVLRTSSSIRKADPPLSLPCPLFGQGWCTAYPYFQVFSLRPQTTVFSRKFREESVLAPNTYITAPSTWCSRAAGIHQPTLAPCLEDFELFQGLALETFRPDGFGTLSA
jgi:hypothetical protein